MERAAARPNVHRQHMVGHAASLETVANECMDFARQKGADHAVARVGLPTGLTSAQRCGRRPHPFGAAIATTWPARECQGTNEQTVVPQLDAEARHLAATRRSREREAANRIADVKHSNRQVTAGDGSRGPAWQEAGSRKDTSHCRAECAAGNADKRNSR